MPFAAADSVKESGFTAGVLCLPRAVLSDEKDYLICKASSAFHCLLLCVSSLQRKVTQNNLNASNSREISV